MRIRPPLSILFAALLLSSAAVGCNSKGSSPTTTAKAPPAKATTPPTVPATPITAPRVPTGASSAEAAASDLIDAWSRGDRPAAAATATAGAIQTLFAARYPGSGQVVDRGCGDVPVVCSFGPSGGGNPDDALYQITVAQEPGGRWYVNGVQVVG